MFFFPFPSKMIKKKIKKNVEVRAAKSDLC